MPQMRPGRLLEDGVGREARSVALQCAVHLGEAADEPVPPFVVRDEVQHGTRQRFGRRVVLQQLRHEEFAGHDVRQSDVRDVALATHDPRGQPGHPVRNHHRTLVKRGLERGRAARDQRHVAGFEAIVRATCRECYRSRQHRMLPQRGLDRRSQCRIGDRQHERQRRRLAPQPRHRRNESRRDEPDFVRP
jgi:hypothetical protein